jgi:hypothetical protein
MVVWLTCLCRYSPAPQRPITKYTSAPENVLKYANFMHEIGSTSSKPAQLKRCQAFAQGQTA